MSDTPRTDALIAQLVKDSGCHPEGNDIFVIELLRQFERELAKAYDEIGRLTAILECEP